MLFLCFKEELIFLSILDDYFKGNIDVLLSVPVMRYLNSLASYF